MATALREVLAEFQIKVDLSELKVADAAIDQFIAKLRDLESLIKSMPPLKFPKAGGGGGGSKGGSKSKDPSVPTQDFDSEDAMRRRAEALAGLEGKHRDLTARLFDQALAQAKLSATIKAFKDALAQSGTVSDASKKKLAGLEQQYYRVSNSIDQTKSKLDQLKPKLDEVASPSGFFGKMKALFGSESSRRAQGELIPGGAIKNLQEASREGDGLFAVLGRLRRMWGLLQFSVSGGFALAGIKGLINEIDDANDAAIRLGVTIEEFQTLSMFAKFAGASVEQLGNSVKQLSKNMINATEGAKAQAAAFKDLGITNLKNVDGTYRDSIEVLFEVGGALGQLTDDAKRTAYAQRLLGKEGLALIPGFKEGKEAALAQLAALRELTVAYNQADAEAAGAFNDTLDISIRQLRSVALQGVSILLPYLVSLVTWLSQTAKQIKDIIRTSSGLQSAFIALGVAIGAHVVSKLWMAITNLKLLQKLLLRGAQIALRFVLPFLLLESLVTWLRGGDSYLGRLLDKFKPGNKDSKQWLETVLNGFKKFQDAIKLVESAWRVLWAKFRNRGELLSAEDIANNAELLKLWEEIKAGANKALGEIWATFKTEAGKALKEMWANLFKPGGQGVPDESALVRIGTDIGGWILAGLAAKLVGSFAISTASEFAKGFVGEIARIMFLGGRTAALALGQGMLQASAPLFARAVAIGSGIATSIGSGILAAMAAVTAPVMAVAVAAGAILLLIFSEKAREVAYDIGEKLVDGIIWIVKAIMGWGPKIWNAAKYIAKGFVQAHIDAINAIVEYVPKIKAALVNAITNFNWGDFFNAGLNAIKRLGTVIGKVFEAVGDFLKNPFAFLDGIGSKIKEIVDNTERIAWGSAGRGISNLTQEELDGITGAGGLIAKDTIRTPQTIIDKRSVSQNFTGVQNPNEIRQATAGAVRWVDSSSNAFLDAQEVGN